MNNIYENKNEKENVYMIHGKKYNLDKFVKIHPGGSKVFDTDNDNDVTNEFFTVAHHGNYHLQVLEKYRIPDSDKIKVYKSNGSLRKKLYVKDCCFQLEDYSKFCLGLVSLYMFGGIFGYSYIGWWDLGIGWSLSQVMFIFHNVMHHRYLSHGSFRFSNWFLKIGGDKILIILGSFASMKSGVFYAIHHRRHHMICDDIEERDPYGGFYSGWRYGLMMFPSDKRLKLKDSDWTDWTVGGRNRNRNRNRNYWDERFHRWHDRYAQYQGVIWLLLVLWFSGDENRFYDVIRWFCIPVLCNVACFWLQTLPHFLPLIKSEDEKCYPSNLWICGLLTGGEGYHGNHHDTPKKAKIGKKWYEIDLGYWMIWGMEKLGVVDLLIL